MRIFGSLAVLASVSLLSACGFGADNAAVEGIETPNGVELTPPGTTLSFGETANVVVQGSEDEPMSFWAITGEEFYDVSVEEAVANAGGDVVDDQETIDHFICAPYTLTFLGTEDPAGYENADSTSTPDMGLMGDGNRMANFIFGGGGSDACGIHDSETAPTNISELEVGREYRGVVLSFVEKEADDEGVEPTTLNMDYRVETVPELIDGNEIKKVLWK